MDKLVRHGHLAISGRPYAWVTHRTRIRGGAGYIFDPGPWSNPNPVNVEKQLTKIVYDLLGLCRLCGGQPELSLTGHRSFSGPTVYHDCPELSGSPAIIFSIAQWVQNCRQFA